MVQLTHPLKKIPLSDIYEAFLLEEKRSVSKTGIINVCGNEYEVEPFLCGKDVKIRYDPYNLSYGDFSKVLSGINATSYNVITKVRAACFEAKLIEEWMGWLKTTKKNSNDTCNVRLGALRSFISFLGKQEPEYIYLPAEASCIRRMKKNFWGKEKFTGINWTVNSNTKRD